MFYVKATRQFSFNCAEADIDVANGEVIVGVHRYVLSMRSKILQESRLIPSWRYKACAGLFGVSTEVLRLLLKFMYKGEAYVPRRLWPDFFMQAKRLGVINDMIVM